MFTPRMSYVEIEAQIQDKGLALLKAIREGKLLYDKWYDLTYGLTDAQILQLPSMAGVTQEELTAMKYAIGVFNDIAAGNALSPAVLSGYLVKFL